jgi:hypothetical protein
MRQERLRLTHPNYKPITDADSPADRKPAHWLS